MLLLQPSQVVWTVPLIGSLGGPINGYAVHVDSTRCLIGDEEGKSNEKQFCLQRASFSPENRACLEARYVKLCFSSAVVELNESVVPTRVFELSAGIKCIVQDADFTYIGCDDGGLYGTPRTPVSHWSCRNKRLNASR